MEYKLNALLRSILRDALNAKSNQIQRQLAAAKRSKKDFAALVAKDLEQEQVRLDELATLLLNPDTTIHNPTSTILTPLPDAADEQTEEAEPLGRSNTMPGWDPGRAKDIDVL